MVGGRSRHGAPSRAKNAKEADRYVTGLFFHAMAPRQSIPRPVKPNAHCPGVARAKSSNAFFHVKRLHLASYLHRHGIAVAVLAFSTCWYAHPAFRNAILFNVGFFHTIEVDADLECEDCLVEMRAFGVDAQAVWQGGF